MYNIVILGSCVTRDIFRLFPGHFNVVAYFARTSIISLMSDPLLIKESDINLDSAFQRRLILYDFNKLFFPVIKKADFDCLMIDFIDERFDLLKYDNCYVTRSPEMVNSKLETKFNFELIKRNVPRTHELWEESCDSFIYELKKSISLERIILHKAFWAEKYCDNNVIRDFSQQQLEGIRKNNIILERYHSFFQSRLQGISILELGKGSFVADKDHQWGLSPFHYEENYYLESKNQILKVYE